MRGRPASGPDGRQILRELFLLLHATKSRLENESFYGALSNDDQGRALDLLDEMAPQLMELETNKDPALLAQIQAFHGRLRPAIQRLRKNLDQMADLPAFFAAAADLLATVDKMLTPARGRCLP